MYEKERLSSEEINKRAKKLGLTTAGDKEHVFIYSTENKTENEIQLETIELERRGFKKVEEENSDENHYKFCYDASLATPRE